MVFIPRRCLLSEIEAWAKEARTVGATHLAIVVETLTSRRFPIALDRAMAGRDGHSADRQLGMGLYVLELFDLAEDLAAQCNTILPWAGWNISPTGEVIPYGPIYTERRGR